jgi:hypothetical protein
MGSKGLVTYSSATANPAWMSEDWALADNMMIGIFRVLFGPQSTGDLDTVHAGHHDVEDDHIRLSRIGPGPSRLLLRWR